MKESSGQRTLREGWYHNLAKMAKSAGKCHMTNVTHHSHISGCHSVISHNEVT